MRGLATVRNMVTCADPSGCVHPGIVLVPHRSPAIEYRLVDGIPRTHECPVVELEYCAHHAGLIEAERAEGVTGPEWQPVPLVAAWLKGEDERDAGR